jgi:hypothetical protein
MSNIRSVDEKVAEKRERVPVHESRDRFKFRGLNHDAYYYRLVKKNDLDRVAKFLDAGYVFVTKGGSVSTDNSIKTVDSTQGTSSLIEVPGGLGVTLVMMALPKELWDADQKTKEENIRASEADMYRDLKSKSSPQEGNYGGVEEFGSKGNSTAR